MPKVTFIAPGENKILRVSHSKLANKTVATLQEPPALGFEIIDFETGTKYKVVRVKDVRRRRLKATPFVDFIAEVDRTRE
jgi:hypothetical protein